VTAFAVSRTRGHLLFERNLMVYRRTWLTLISGFFEPIFYLFSLGLGLGHFIGDVHGVSYAAYIAPALLASSAMNGAVYDGMTNVFWKLRYGKVYDAMLATPMGPTDVAVGETAWAQFRGLLYATGFVITVAALGLVESWWGVLALPAAVVVGFGFAGMAIGTSTFIRSWQDFDTVQLVQLPMFLFRHLLPALGVSAGDPVARALLAALPRDDARPLVHDRHGRAGEPRERRLPAGPRPLRDVARPAANGRASAHLARGSSPWAIVDSNHGPPPYQSGALTN
jgi:lipooligosaccharide transport system permease protein